MTLETEISNLEKKAVSVELVSSVKNKEGKTVVQTIKKLRLNDGETETVPQSLNIQKPFRWSTESPYLYTLVSEVKAGKKVLDRVETRFGVRDVEWKPETGMWLNGKNVKMQGVCNHQDAGALGAAVSDKILRFRIQQLKDMGCNAIRTAHNPQTPQFYDLCDEMGMLVMDELFDGWKRKAENDYGAQAFNRNNFV